VNETAKAGHFAPLDGLRVIDLTTSVAGPYATQLLGSLGADVIKIEALAGDSAREWKPPAFEDRAPLFLVGNAGKRSVAVDLRRGSAVVKRLANGADILVQSLRPGLVDDLGLTAAALRAENSKLIYCSVRAYGRVGPKADLPGYDSLMQAAGGIMSVTGEPGQSPVRAGVSLVDYATGIWAAFAVVSAVLERQRTGEGTVIDVALYETAIAFMAHHIVGYLGSGNVPQPVGTGFSGIAPYELFDVRDGSVMIAAATDRMFQGLVDVLGLTELAADPRFSTNGDRVAHRDQLHALLRSAFGEQDRDSLLDRLVAAGVPASAVNNVGDVVADEQTRAAEMIQTFDGIPLIAPPMTFDGTRASYRSGPPEVGGQTVEVLTEAGFSDAEISALRDDGIIAGR
jgi:crotonobetainyl-CoA:carnitine CoA-transferase CaiB-like acyl-CoA transferase